MRLLVQLAAIAVVEVASIALLASYLGALPTFLIYAIPTFIGFVIQLHRRQSMLAAWREMKIDEDVDRKHEGKLVINTPAKMAAGVEHYTYWLSTVLLLIPGPITSIAAFYYLLPSNIAEARRLAIVKAREMDQVAPHNALPAGLALPILPKRKPRKRRRRTK